jgi:protease IV
MMKRLITCMLLLLSHTVVFAEEEIRFPMFTDVFYFRPASSVFGAEALWCNPAALSEYKSRSFQLIGEIKDGYVGRNWGTVSNERSFALAYRQIYLPHETDIQEYIGGVGFSAGKKLALGASYRKFTRGPDQIDNKHLWTIGSLMRMGENLTFAAVGTNLNRNRIDGIRSRIEWEFSAASRSRNGKFTASASAFVSSNLSNEKPHWIFTGEYTAAKGILLTASIESDRSWQAGARVNLEHYFTGAISSFARSGDSRGTAVYGGWTEKRQETSFSPRPKRISHRVQGRIQENPVQPVFGAKQLPFLLQLHSIYRAADDPSVAELLIGFDNASFGLAQAQELRMAIAYFRSRGKYVTCHLRTAGNAAYYVASSANRIIMSPHDQLNLTGLRAEVTYWAGTLEKIGVKAEILKIGDYKSAAERLTRREPSEPAQNQMNRILDNLYGQLVAGIAEGRQMSDSAVRQIIDNGPFTTEDALSSRLVDAEGRWEKLQENRLVADRSEISLREYVTDSVISNRWSPEHQIAVVVVDGEIMPDKGAGLPFQPDDAATPSLLYKGLSQALREPSVKCIVLRIDSPGGFATAADDMFFLLKEAKKSRPIIVSMGNLAASGGYQIAAAGDNIFANPATITGSIGIFGGKVDMSGLDQKIGVHRELYTRGANAGFLTLSRPWTEREQEKYFSLLKTSYGYFVHSVAESRKMSEDSVDNLGQGRVWTGKEAAVNGLVSTEGGLMPAIQAAAQLVNANEYTVSVYPKRRTLFSFRPRGLLSGFVRQTAKLLGLSDENRLPVEQLPDGALMTRLPYDIAIE